MKDLNQWTREEFLVLPKRRWDKPEEYGGIIFFSTRKKHDSGYSMITVVGCEMVDLDPVEIISHSCDDINWELPAEFVLDKIRTDCLMRSGAMRMWLGCGLAFKVMADLSSLQIEVVRK